MTLHLLGIDIAKNVFQLHGVGAAGRVVFRRRVMRDSLLQVIAQLEPCTIAIEPARERSIGSASSSALVIQSRSSARST